MKSLFRPLLAAALMALATVASLQPVAWASQAAARLCAWVLAPCEPGYGMLGANTLTSLIPALYEALDVVSRELVGFLPGIMRDAQVERAAVGQQVLSPIVPPGVMSDITPGVTPPNDGDVNVGNLAVTITKSKRVPFRWTGEDERGLNANGAGAQVIKGYQIQQALRTLVNAMEADVWAAARVGASRAFGTPGTTPFATDLSSSAQLRKILDDNGAPGQRSLVIDTTAGANLRTLGQLTKANEAGTTMTRSDGMLIDLHGFAIRESGAVNQNAAGTGAGYTTTAAGFPVGTTAIPLITGAGTIVPGDVITIAGDVNKYVVAAGIAAPGTITLAAPGLRKAIPTAATAVTVLGSATQSIAFAQSALLLATRAPALPDGGDMAVDRMTVTDPRSGISFELALYPQYRQMQYEVSAAWGAAATKANHIAMLLG